MSGGEFTKGPWHFDELRPCDDGLGYIRCSGDTLEIAHHGDSGRSAEENRANARLIAAAPDMYEALELAKTALLSAKPIMAHYPEPNDRHKAAFDAVNAALSRASGKEA